LSVKEQEKLVGVYSSLVVAQPPPASCYHKG
jgi:hypothetical protein